MKNFLLISYYWPPSGGVGVQRWLKLTKYLPESGWKPVILTPENPAFELRDPSLEKEVHPEAEVIQLPILEPYHIIQKVSGAKPDQLIKSVFLENKEAGLLEKTMRWIRGNIFVPDPRVFWVRSATRFAQDLLVSNNIEAIITTGPPHSMHLIGLKLKKKTGLPWIADFRDPWTDWEILHRMNPSSFSMKLHKNLEQQVVAKADLVLTASSAIGKSLGVDTKKLRVLTNGVDPDVLGFQGQQSAEAATKFVLQYTGLMNNKRNPECLWQALESLCRENSSFHDDLEVRIAGQVGEGVVKSLEEKELLKHKVQFMGYLPQQEVYPLLLQASVLLLLIDNDPAASLIIPAKLFEYLAAQKPVLYIGDPQNDAAAILEKEKVGESFTFADSEGPKRYVEALYKEFCQQRPLQRPVVLTPYLRTTQAGRLAQWLHELVPHTDDIS